MASDLQILWGSLFYDVLKIKNDERNLSDEKIRIALEKRKKAILQIKVLDLSCLPIKSPVKEIALFESLEEVNFSNCQLQELSSSLSRLKSLKIVSFRDNSLDDLSQIAMSVNPVNLQSLDLSKNAFSVLPDAFLTKFDASKREAPLHVNLTGNIWLEEDETLQNIATRYNWVIQLDGKFF